jgi:hypothetical protein
VADRDGVVGEAAAAGDVGVMEVIKGFFGFPYL